jgi:pre-mRNA-splicing factor ISY1
MKDINADYYGYRDEDDGLIVPLEEEEEKKGLQNHKMSLHMNST